MRRENLKVRDDLESSDAERKIILKWDLKAGWEIAN
jgi:hypothetical protein